MLTILIVDDQESIRNIYVEELTEEGYLVFTTGTCKSKLLKAHLKVMKPDLILLDLCLEGIEGVKLIGEIKGFNPDIAVIINTAYDSLRDHPGVSQADGCLLKSPNLSVLKQKIADVLRFKIGHNLPQE